MENEKSSRRSFIKSSAIGLGGLTLPAMITPSPEASSLNTENRMTIICLGAHPGDPEFGCGGTMAKYSKAGHNVLFFYLTRGEAYDTRQSFDKSAALRTKEAEISCGILHAHARFVGQIDGNTELNNKQSDEVAKLIIAEKPDIVFTHWPLDSHQDHQVAGLLALTAWIRSDKKFDLFFYEVNSGSETMQFTPTDYVDITDFRDVKKAAMFAHKTQSPEKVYDDYFKAMEEFRGLEAGVKAAEGFIHFKSMPKRASIIGL